MLGVLLIAAALASGFTGYTEITDTDADGYTVTRTIIMIDGEIVENTEQLTTKETSLMPCPYLKAEVIWVDRNHNFAIAKETVISSDGEGIFVSWCTNNERVSFYDTDGTESPIWSYAMPDDEWGMDVAAGQNIFVLSAGSPEDGVYAWLSSSPVPTLTLEPGDKQDITEDGLYLVKLNESGDTLICIDTSSETEVWRTYIVTSVISFNGIDISEDGSRVLVSFYDAGNGARVYDMTNGNMVGEPVGNYGQTMARISGDGSRFITGDFNARIKLYEYNGTSWDLAANIASGDEWVNSVAISGDGETLAGGTWENSPVGGRVIAIDWPQGCSPSVLWEYTNYGDNVSSVDICGDGSRIVAGCYGMYEGTFGDVFTAFDRSGNVMFSLLDDIDEPGSIYSVSVSSDGCYATTSGKAVHAYTSGNGGEVYSISLLPEGIEENPDIPQDFFMGALYPNPVTSQMSVEFLIPRTGVTVDIAVYDINGRRVATLNSETAPGEHVSIWNLRSDSGELSSTGLYFVRLSTPGTVITRKILVVN